MSDTTAMQVGVRYIVTRASKGREFQRGDHICLHADGSILNQEAEGWMPPEDLPSATRGMTFRLDEEWIAKRRAKLERQLAALQT